MRLQSNHPLLKTRCAGVAGIAVAVDKMRQQYVEDAFGSFVLRYDYAPARFFELRERWSRETQFASSVTEIALNSSYQAIIGMGESVLPLILRDLAATSDHWFWALMAITGKDPVAEEHRGDVAAMKRDWIMWAQSEGLI